MLLGGLTFAGVLLVMIAVFTMIYLHVHPGCSDEIVSESVSPNRRFVAAIMQRRCGEESAFVTHINLRPADRGIHYGFFSGKAEQGEIYSIEQDTQNLHLTVVWNAANELTIRCRGCRNASKWQESWQSVVVHYKSSE